MIRTHAHGATLLKWVLASTFIAPSVAFAEGKPVNLLTAVPAESELIFEDVIERAGGVNVFAHARFPATVETQTIVRSQSDMLYSQAVFDASQGLTVEVPNCTTGYQSVHLFDANHGQLGVVYCGEQATITSDDISTVGKHVFATIRTSTDQGLKVANAAQDAVKVIAGSAEPYVGPGYDRDQLAQAKRVMAGAASIVKSYTAPSHDLIPDTVLLKGASDVDQYNYIFASLLGWGLMPTTAAYYPQLVIGDNDCTEVSFAAPPVNTENGGYWSFTAYNLAGYLATESPVVSAYSAEPNDDGTFSVFVGNSSECAEKANQVDMPEGGASITLRLYRPISLEAAQGFETSFRTENAGK